MDPTSVVPWVIASFIVLFLVLHASGRRRSEAFHRFARRKGMSFVKKPDLGAAKQFDRFKLIPNNVINTVSNIIKGEVDGVSSMICDLQATKLTGNTSVPSHQTRQTVLILEEDKVDLPFFTMHPANFTHRILHTFRTKNVDFPSHPDFSHTYVLKGDNEHALRKLFHDQVVAYFINHKGLSIEGRGNKLLYFRGGKYIKPAELNTFLSEGLTVFRMFQ